VHGGVQARAFVLLVLDLIAVVSELPGRRVCHGAGLLQQADACDLAPFDRVDGGVGDAAHAVLVVLGGVDVCRDGGELVDQGTGGVLRPRIDRRRHCSRSHPIDGETSSL
jgi:hypothetical protein